MVENNNDHCISAGKLADEFLFDAGLLQSIFDNHSLKDSKLSGNMYDGRYLLRPLAITDYDHGYIELLRQLTECGTISSDAFQQRFHQMKGSPNTYYVLVIEDTLVDKHIVGTATLL